MIAGMGCNAFLSSGHLKKDGESWTHLRISQKQKKTCTGLSLCLWCRNFSHCGNRSLSCSLASGKLISFVFSPLLPQAANLVQTFPSCPPLPPLSLCICVCVYIFWLRKVWTKYLPVSLSYCSNNELRVNQGGKAGESLTEHRVGGFCNS